MKIPDRLLPLLEAHLVDDVVTQLKSGKEAEVYVVLSEGEYRCAKVYKEASNRSFKHTSQYTEGRKVRSSRRSRAMNSNSRYGRQEREAEWHNTEVEALAMLAAAGVRVPRTHSYYEGVLLLEMITDANGSPAPRLSELRLTKDEAKKYFLDLMREVVRMLCAGYVHGDLSEFNVLLGKDGLVIIDLPQAVQATSQSAFSIFERDMAQLAAYFGKFAPEILNTEYTHEIWTAYQNGRLRPDTKLTGTFKHSTKAADVRGIMEEIDDVRDEEMERRGFRKK